MTQFFEHTPQSNNVVNQVENLAQEVGDAFLKVEDILHQDTQENASITSSIGSLDNKYIKEYVPNTEWISNYQQTLFFPPNSQSASLDLYPSTLTEDLNTVSVSNLANPSKTYTYKNNGILENDTDFTFVERKVIFGIAPSSSDNIRITYKGFNTTTPEDNQDWPFELKYNVLQVKTQQGIVREFSATQVLDLYTIQGYDFKSMCSTFIQNIINNYPHELNKYVAFYSGGERLETYNVTITNSFVRFSSETVVTAPVKIYVANASLGKLIECLYRLFYAHDHGANGGQGVNHSSILGLYSNNDEIKYQSTDKVNYDHPQYLNREGYIADSTVYNNAILGDILLASTSENNRRNNLEANSVKLVFGEYNSGARFYYNKNEDCLWLDSISRDGIKLVTPTEKKALSINDHSFVDTQIISSNTNKALKLTLKTDNDDQLGVFKLSRKIIRDGVETDDDKAKLLSYASEFSLVNIKDDLIIENNAQISFGNPSIITLKLQEDGLHFGTDSEGSLTDITKVIFDVPVKADQMSVKHLDADEIHLSEDRRIVFGETDHTTPSTQFINYNNSKLTVKTNNSVTINNNGRQRGISLDDRHFIYASTAQGFNIQDTVEFTDLYFETKRDTYFLQAGYAYNAGITNLQTVPRSSIYCDNSYVNNVRIEFDDTLIKGVILNNNNRIFAQRDLVDNIGTFVQSPGGLYVVSSYNLAGPSFNYGKVYARTYTASGDRNTDAGFFGNIIVPVNHKITINGDTEFNNSLTFNKPVTFTDDVAANKLSANEIRTNNLYVSENAVYNNVEVIEELRFNSLLQTNRASNSSFEGTVQFNNNVVVPDSNNSIILGNRNIEDTRKTAGLYLNHSEVRLGTNGLVSAGKFFANKGGPSGNGDRSAGYSFATTDGVSDGDTGMYAEKEIDNQNGSDIVFRIDGVEKGRILKEGLDLNSLSFSGKEKALVTLDMFLDQVSGMGSTVLGQVYPIGTIYENAVDSRNPSIILDWPTSIWRRYAIGRSIIGASGTGIGESIDSDLTPPDNFNISAAGTKLGDYTCQLKVEHLPNHKHRYTSDDQAHGAGGTTGRKMGTDFSQRSASGGAVEWFTTTEFPAESGGDKPHSILQPVIVTHVWERIG